MATFEPKKFGKYYLLEKLAVGGMAEIYKAKTYGAEGFEKLLAIKKILPHAAADMEFIDMLVDEAKLSVVLSHANIVQVYDLGKVGDDYFISMEFIHGINLRDVLYRLREKNKRMPIELAVYVISEVCKGLDYAHRKTDSNNQPLGIVHRDISPQNILISYEGEVKIVDFGIAKAAMNISHTMAGILKGKIAYMSPEQAMGKAVDAKTDLFSLGILFYEALSGKKLYTGESQFEVLKKIRTTRIDTNKLPESIPDVLKPIVAKALAYRPEERYNSASDMQVALTKYLYATYTDFSPRKLAAFVKDLFQDESVKDRKEGSQIKELDIQTGSVSLLQSSGTAGTQEDLVHRDLTPKPSTSGLTGTKSVTVSERLTPGKKRRLLPMILTALAVIGLGFFGWHFFTSSKSHLQQGLMGTLQITSQPAGAAIRLNGKETKLKTPAILENLKLNEKYTVDLNDSQYGNMEESVVMENTEPKKLFLDLTKNLGVLNIISEPSGASILVNGIASGQVTPSTLDKLALNTEYKIMLSKPGFEDVEQPITLASPSPQKWMASLKPYVPAPAPAPDIPAPPVTPPEPVQPAAIPKPAEVAPEEIIGKIDVRSNPSGAKIFLNGKDTGKTTPAVINDLSRGRYTLRLLKDNFQPMVRGVNVTSSKSYSIEEKLQAMKVPVEKPAPPPAPEPTPTAPVQTSGGEGSIRITSSPSGADVFVNGEKQGVTPTTVKAKAGNAKILVIKGEDKLPCKEMVSVQAGSTSSINCNLGELFGKVDVSSVPPRADVFFDGKKLNGKTPMTIEKVKRDREHTIRLEVEGFKPWERSFNLEDKESKAFNVELER